MDPDAAEMHPDIRNSLILDRHHRHIGEEIPRSARIHPSEIFGVKSIGLHAPPGTGDYAYFSLQAASKRGCGIYTLRETGQPHYVTAVTPVPLEEEADLRFVGHVGPNDFQRTVRCGESITAYRHTSGSIHMTEVASNDQRETLDERLLVRYVVSIPERRRPAIEDLD